MFETAPVGGWQVCPRFLVSSAKFDVVSGSSGCCTFVVFIMHSSGQKGSFVVATWFLCGNSAR